MMARSVRRHRTALSGDGSLQEKLIGKGEEEKCEGSVGDSSVVRPEESKKE
jgi:hypothetical protein